MANLTVTEIADIIKARLDAIDVSNGPVDNTGATLAIAEAIVTSIVLALTDEDITVTLVNDGRLAETNAVSTGGLSGGKLTVNNPDKFDIAPLKGIVIDVATNQFKTIDFAGRTAVAPAYLATDPVTYVGINENGVVQRNRPFNNKERRSVIPVGVVVHSDNTIVNVINDLQVFSDQPYQQFLDFVNSGYAFANIDGNLYSPAGSNLQIKKTSGDVFKLHINSLTDPNDPHTETLAAADPVTFRYRLQDSTEYPDTTNINPTQYDNSGVLTAVPAGKYTVQRLTVFPSGENRIQYGQKLYDTLPDAVAGINDDFIIEKNIEDNGLLRCFIITRNDVTDLSDERYTMFVEAHKLGHKSKTEIPADIYRRPIYNATATGLLTGGVITINALDNTTIDLSAGSGQIVDNTTNPFQPIVKEIFWDDFTAVTVDNLATNDFTYFLIDENDQLIQQSTEPTTTQFRNFVVIGVAVHINRTIVEGVSHIPRPAYNDPLHTLDLFRAIGEINVTGNEFTSNGANLTVSKSGGETFGIGFNYANSIVTPNNVISGALIAPDLRYIYRNGSGGLTFEAPSPNVKPAFRDNGTGTLVAVNNNKWTIQRLYFNPESDGILVAYGQNEYNTAAEARAAIVSEPFTLPVPARSAVRCFLVVRGGATNLSLSTDAIFNNTSKFGAATASSAVATGTLQTAYNNSLVPQITTSGLGPVTVRGGVDNTTNIIQGQNTSGVNTFTVRADGRIESAGNKVWHEGDFYPVGSAELTPATTILEIKDTQGTVIASVDLSTLNNEGTTITFNGTTEEIELRNDEGVLLSSFPASSLVSNVGHSIGFNAGTAYRLELRNGSGAVLSSVDLNISRINGLQTALDGKLDGTATTDDVNEGVSNLYYTDVRARNAISASGDLSYNATTGVISFSETYSTPLEIKTAYESNTNTNAYTDIEKSKLAGIESGATVGADWDNNLTNIPTAFPPTSHTHTTSEITNLSSYTGFDSRYYTETEIGNFFSGSTAITGYNKTNWDTAYSWGNWATGVDKAFVDALNVDADTLDSLNSTDFVRSTGSVTQTINGAKTFEGSVTIGNNADFLLFANNGTQANGVKWASNNLYVGGQFSSGSMVLASNATPNAGSDSWTSNGEGAQALTLDTDGNMYHYYNAVGASTDTFSNIFGTGSKVHTDANFGKTQIDALGINADTLDGVQGVNYTRLDTTNLGRTGNVPLTSQWTTPAEWASLPVGFSQMIRNTTGTAGGAPVNNNGYFTKVANRDTAGGWGGLWVGYANGENYVGRASTNGDFATWEKIYTDVSLTKAVIDGLNVNADTLDSLNSTDFVRSTGSVNQTISGNKTFSDGLEANVYNVNTQINYPHPTSGAINQSFYTDDYLRFRCGGSSTPKGISVSNYDTTNIYLNRNGTITSIKHNLSSDVRFKKHIDDYLNLQTSDIKARLYERDNEIQIGYYAQDVIKIIPEAVTVEKTDKLKDEHFVNYDMVHTAKIAHLENKIAQLEQLIERLLNG